MYILHFSLACSKIKCTKKIHFSFKERFTPKVIFIDFLKVVNGVNRATMNDIRVAKPEIKAFLGSFIKGLVGKFNFVHHCCMKEELHDAPLPGRMKPGTNSLCNFPNVSLTLFFVNKSRSSLLRSSSNVLCYPSITSKALITTPVSTKKWIG